MIRPDVRLLPAFAGLLLLSACQSPAPSQSLAPSQFRGAGTAHGDAATQAFCRQRAEEIYGAQNRGALYQSDNRDSPFSSNYVPSVTSRGLSDRYAMEQMVSDCIRNTGERSNPTQAPAASPTPPPPPPAATRVRAPA